MANRFGQGLIKTEAIAIGLITAYIVSIFFGMVDFSTIAETSGEEVDSDLYGKHLSGGLLADATGSALATLLPSGILVGGITAFILNLVLPKDEGEKYCD
ncbi:MAG: hypothetical protein ACOCRO_02415 [Halanaerobiales bacterium]